MAGLEGANTSSRNHSESLQSCHFCQRKRCHYRNSSCEKCNVPLCANYSDPFRFQRTIFRLSDSTASTYLRRQTDLARERGNNLSKNETKPHATGIYQSLPHKSLEILNKIVSLVIVDWNPWLYGVSAITGYHVSTVRVPSSGSATHSIAVNLQDRIDGTDSTIETMQHGCAINRLDSQPLYPNLLHGGRTADTLAQGCIRVLVLAPVIITTA